MVKRLFVEKKPGFDVEAQKIRQDLIDSLGLPGDIGLRLWNRYDVDGVTGADFDRARNTIFSEPNVDDVYDEALPLDASDQVFAVEYLPGQYDQRADSAAQCVQLLTQGDYPQVRSARVYALQGVTTEQLKKIQEYLVNPVESRLASMDKPADLNLNADRPADVAVVEGFTAMSDEEIAAYHAKMEMAMTAQDLCFCRDYFQSEGRDPSVTELRVIDTYWSDHCRHTTFATILEEIEIEKSPLNRPVEEALEAYYAARKEVYGERHRNVSLMDIATMGMKLLKKRGMLQNLDESEEINACSIEVPVTIDGKTEQWLIQFKNETHNHPTEIEPFGGAATCLGGAIRDPLSGRAYVYQAMRVTGSGDPTVPFGDTMKGKLPQKKITTEAAHGYSSYGNQIGLSTGQVAELYHEGYLAKRLEIGAVVGASPKENVMRGVPAPGDVIVLLGGRTGRDGCGGATGSSKAHDDHSVETCGAQVQKGNPPTERKIQRLFRHPEVAKMIKRCNDFGAGGVCVAIGELADGLRIDLDAVPKKYDGLDGTELAISESQERMAVVLDPSDAERFAALSAQENLEATKVAVVTEQPRLVMEWRGKVIVDMSREFLNTNGVTGKARARITAPMGEDYRNSVPAALAEKSLPEAFVSNLSRLEVASQKGLSERFDSSIGASTVLMPFAGAYQMTPEEAMVAKIPVLKGQTDDATAMSFGYMPRLTQQSPFHGSVWAVMESLSKLAAVGADPLTARLTFQEYFERLHEKPERWGKPAAALLGGFLAQCRMGAAAIGGKDSMSGSFNDLDVPPTLVSFALAMTKASKTMSAAFQGEGGAVVLLPLPAVKETRMPDFEAAKAVYGRLLQWLEDGTVRSASVVKEGGAAAQIAKMAFGNRLGVQFTEQDRALLFAPLSASFVLEMNDPAPALEMGGVVLGKTIKEPEFRFADETVGMAQALEAYCGKLESVFPTKAQPKAAVRASIPLFAEKNGRGPSVKAARPNVFIPVFPGTNCEYDTARAFEQAGAQAEILVVKNLTPAAIEETIEAMVKAVNRAQIIMFPGGFSGGDEPDGSGKFIATTFRNPRLKEAAHRLLQERDGLMLGICNGFQALIKLGLLPYGEIREQLPDDPTLTFNTIGRHVSQMVYTRVTSVKSPWLSLCSAGDVHTIPVSHGEGRFVANAEWIERLSRGGQVATQYVGLDGKPAQEMPFNPNGSVCAIEGITSPDGRILGKMGHSERKNRECYKNVPGAKDQKLFEAGVLYFQ